MTNKQTNLKQLILQWRKRRKHDRYNNKCTRDDESSLSNREIQELTSFSNSTNLLLSPSDSTTSLLNFKGNKL